ncbi:nucleotidyltransferase family protein [Atrimonas thermophila]|uniref:nucleotidyltransferase family protein n=1 Tax=Atrimonas thermophila TaxID=3064161 RepID=UPI00399CC8D5
MADALILAGGGEGEIEKKFGVRNRALLVIEDRFMIEYVIEALRSVSSINRVVVVGPVREFQSRIGKLVDAVVAPGDNPFQSALQGLEFLRTQEKVLVASCDIPLIKGEMIEDFFLRCSKKEADFYYPIIREESYVKKFGKSRRTFAALRDGRFTGGNILYLDPSVFEKKRDLVEKIVESRKNPLTIARLLGLTIIVKYLLRMLTIEEIEKRVEKVTGIRGKAIITPYPEIGFDVDRAEHVEMVKEFLKKRS